jgi:hypothetical protein
MELYLPLPGECEQIRLRQSVERGMLFQEVGHALPGFRCSSGQRVTPLRPANLAKSVSAASLKEIARSPIASGINLSTSGSRVTVVQHLAIIASLWLLS